LTKRLPADHSTPRSESPPGAGTTPAHSATPTEPPPDPGPTPAHSATPTEPGVGPVPGLAEALACFATGVTLVVVADGRDDIGTTVSAFCPVSLSPPLVLVSLIASSYPADVLSRADLFAVTLLSSGQRALAGRFAVAGRPSARLLLEGTPHRRGEKSGALIPGGGLAALECAVTERVPGGDHLLVIARVLAVPYVAEAGDPLIRFAGRYPSVH
jgi:flavin reductase (DIM6/NTAB) family NADH-FMN oxidoreductase RutF